MYNIYIYIKYIHIYIRKRNTYIYILIYTYIHIYKYIYISVPLPSSSQQLFSPPSPCPFLFSGRFCFFGGLQSEESASWCMCAQSVLS